MRLEPDVLEVIAAAERRGLRQLSGNAAKALELLLAEVVATGGVAASKTQRNSRSRIVWHTGCPHPVRQVFLSFLVPETGMSSHTVQIWLCNSQFCFAR